MAQPHAPLVLYQFPVSHYCEKARWALDSCGLEYRTRNLVPLAHVPVALALSGKTQVPILKYGRSVIAGSRVILDHLATIADGRAPALQSIGDGTIDWEDLADTRIGPHVRRLVYFHLLDHPHLAAPLLAAGQPAWARASIRAAYPLLAAGMRKGMRIDARGAAISRDRLKAACAQVSERLNTSNYLDGASFSRADLAVAALLAPLYRPHGYGLDWPTTLPDSLNAELEAFSDLREWVLGVYRQHRGK